MLPVHKYVDMQHPQFKDKSDYQIWEVLNFDARLLVMAEYIGDRTEEAIQKLGEKVGEAVIAVMSTNAKVEEEKKTP